MKNICAFLHVRNSNYTQEGRACLKRGIAGVESWELDESSSQLPESKLKSGEAFLRVIGPVKLGD